MRRLLPCLCLGLSLTACASSNREELMDALQEYAHGIRWGSSEWVRPHLPASSQTLDPTALPPGVQVITCELGAVKVLADAKRALASLRVEWYLTQEGRVFNSVLTQTWSFDGKRWLMVEQRLVQGAPFPPPGRSPRRAQSLPRS